MFERFTAEARQAIHLAMAEARAGGSSRIGCEHLLIGLAHSRRGPAGDALAAVGLNPVRLRQLARQQQPGDDAATPLDAEALALVGIDLDEVRRAAEAAFGPGALDAPAGRTARFERAGMTQDTKDALEHALRTVQRANERSISSGHLLVGIIDQGDNAALLLLAAAGVDPVSLRADVVRRMAAAA